MRIKFHTLFWGVELKAEGSGVTKALTSASLVVSPSNSHDRNSSNETVPAGSLSLPPAVSVLLSYLSSFTKLAWSWKHCY